MLEPDQRRHAVCILNLDEPNPINFTSRSPVRESPEQKLLRQLQKDRKNEKHKELQERVDRIAMYLFPMIFAIFNSCYWPYYLIMKQ
jgi:hypothetical protein